MDIVGIVIKDTPCFRMSDSQLGDGKTAKDNGERTQGNNEHPKPDIAPSVIQNIIHLKINTGPNHHTDNHGDGGHETVTFSFFHVSTYIFLKLILSIITKKRYSDKIYGNSRKESGAEIGNFREIRFRQQVFISSC